jgi:hypothetical protein
MKITNSILLSSILATSIFYARPSTANECTNSSTNPIQTSDLVSIGSRSRKAFSYFQLYTFTEESKFAVFACTVTGKTSMKFGISDDSSLLLVDVTLYVNGNKVGTKRMSRGTNLGLKFTPEKVQDYRIEFKLVESNDYGGKIYFIE